MTRWLISKPKYAKQIKMIYQDGNFVNINKSDIRFINQIKSSELNAREFLFERVVEIYGKEKFSTDLISDIIKTKNLIDTCKEQLIFSMAKDIKNIFGPSASEKESLYSIIKEWDEKLEDTTENHLFEDVNPNVLDLLKNIKPDETTFVEKLAKIVTGLRIDDWEDENILPFLDELRNFKKTVEDYNSKKDEKSGSNESESYKVSLIDSVGKEHIKTFNKVDYSSRAKLLKNEIETAIEEMGQSISEAEKRQVLVELLEKMC